MPRFSGKQGEGALRRLLDVRRQEAEERARSGRRKEARSCGVDGCIYGPSKHKKHKTTQEV